MMGRRRWALAGRQVSVVVVVVGCIEASGECTGAWMVQVVHKMAWVVTEEACKMAWVRWACTGALVVVVVAAWACTEAWACMLVEEACKMALVGEVSSVVVGACMRDALVEVGCTMGEVVVVVRCSLGLVAERWSLVELKLVVALGLGHCRIQLEPEEHRRHLQLGL